MNEARKVKSEMEATASAAERGEGGTLTGYASAGFDIDLYKGPKRLTVIIYSKASAALAMAVHFSSQRRTGTGHIRAALYKFTTKTGITRYPIGKNYKTFFGEAKGNKKNSF